MNPFADSSCVPMYKLCEFAAQNVKVVLSGDGADELLAGYSTYRVNNLSRTLRELPSSIRNLILLASKLAPDFGKYSHKEKLSRFLYGSKQGQYLDHAAWRTVIPNSLKSRVYSDDFKKAIAGFQPLELYAKPLNEAIKASLEPLDAMLYADFNFYLPNDMLVKVDKMSMASSLEVRVPFLDMEIVDFCWRLPTDMKLRNGSSKYILKKIISDYYPKTLANKPKSGFNMSPDDLLLPNRVVGGFEFGKYGKFIANYALDIFYDSYQCGQGLLKY